MIMQQLHSICVALQQMDHAIQKMFAAWDSSQHVLKHVMLDSVGKRLIGIDLL